MELVFTVSLFMMKFKVLIKMENYATTLDNNLKLVLAIVNFKFKLKEKLVKSYQSGQETCIYDIIRTTPHTKWLS